LEGPENGKCWYSLWPFGIVYYGHFVIYVVVIWYIFPRFGKLYHEKSGNPGVLSAVTAKNQDLASFIHTYEKGSNLGDQRII
jgi:hypothetical protein